MIALLAVMTFVTGVFGGAIGTVRFLIWHFNKPENARTLLKTMYRQSHPHWLTNDDHDRICPCYGWSETEGLLSTDPCTHKKPDGEPHG